MKRIQQLTLVLLTALMGVALTSCDDEDIAYTLEGTWEGNTYMESYYNGHYYNSTYSYVDFSRDPFTYTSGTGHWVDYYSNAPWDYIASHIDWRVRNGVIEVYFEEDDYTIYIEDYRLDNRHFVGSIYWNRDYNKNFDLVHTSSPNWNSFDYSPGYYYDYAPGKNGARPASRPKRVLAVSD